MQLATFLQHQSGPWPRLHPLRAGAPLALAPQFTLPHPPKTLYEKPSRAEPVLLELLSVLRQQSRGQGLRQADGGSGVGLGQVHVGFYLTANQVVLYCWCLLLLISRHLCENLCTDLFVLSFCKGIALPRAQNGEACPRKNTTKNNFPMTNYSIPQQFSEIPKVVDNTNLFPLNLTCTVRLSTTTLELPSIFSLVPTVTIQSWTNNKYIV